MRSYRLRFPFLALLLLFLPLSAQAELIPVPPFPIADATLCSTLTDLKVIATPKGAFEVVWIDEADSRVKGRRFARNLQPSGPPVDLLLQHGGLNAFDFLGTWAGIYELAINVQDFGDEPSDPAAAYRVQLDLEGDPLAPPARVKPPRFIQLAPAAGGDSLQFRIEPPFFGPATCQSRGVLAQRIDRDGDPLSAESRVNRRASAWSGGPLAVDRLPNDTFVVAYLTCHKFTGVVVRRLNAAGAPVGKPINLTFPDRSGPPELAARGADFAVAVIVFNSSAGLTGIYTRAVVNGQMFGPTRLSSPLPVSGVIDLAASPAGGYLLLFQGLDLDSERRTIFAQELDARGVPQGEPLAITGADHLGVDGAAASLPGGRWLVVTRSESFDFDACTDNLLGTVLTHFPAP